MEKDNKYYEVIESLVKNHKKFNGYEAILDEIIDDVFSHSEVILNTVDNEQVVRSYLEKVVSTSIITIPKKLNFHKEVKHAVIGPSTPLLQNSNNNIVQTQDHLEELLNNKDEAVLKLEPEQDITTDLTEAHEFVEHEEEIEKETENSDSLSSELEITEEEHAVQNFDQIEQLQEEPAAQALDQIEQLQEEPAAQALDQIEQLQEEPAVQALDLIEQLQEEPAVQALDLIEQPQEELSTDVETSSDFIKVDNDLVDKMINLSETSVPIETEEAAEYTKETENKADDDALQQNELNFIELDTVTQEEEESSEENSDIKDIEELKTEYLEQSEDSLNSKLEISDENIENNEFEQEEIQIGFEDSAIDISENANDLQNLEIENTELSEPEIGILESTDFELTQEDNFEIENDPVFDNSSDLNYIEKDNGIILEDTEPLEDINTIEEYNSIDFEHEADFDEKNEIEEISVLEDEYPEDGYNFYSQVTVDPKCADTQYNQEKIFGSISDIASENTGIDLIQLFELKYKQNKNIDEIASELNSSTEDVIEGLNKLISVL